MGSESNSYTRFLRKSLRRRWANSCAIAALSSASGKRTAMPVGKSTSLRKKPMVTGPKMREEVASDTPLMPNLAEHCADQAAASPLRGIFAASLRRAESFIHLQVNLAAKYAMAAAYAMAM